MNVLEKIGTFSTIVKRYVKSVDPLDTSIYPVDSAIGFLNTYPLDGDLSNG